MAALQPRAESDGRGGNDDDDDDDAAHALLALSLLHDLLGVAAFLASHPLHAAYALFFSRHLLSLASFFCPLLVSTSLLLVVLVTVAPYATPEWRPGVRFLGRTCGIAVGALCAELRPDGGGGVGLVGQFCSFVLGPADGAAVLRVGEIMGELCDISGSCFLFEEKSLPSATEECGKLAAELPLQSLIGEKIFLGHDDFDETKDEIEEKNVVSEHLKELKGHHTSSEHRCPSEAFVQEMEDQENNIEEQSLSLSGIDGVSDGVEENRLECDHVSMEIKKCELVKSHSSVSRRIRQWEAQVCGNVKQVLEETIDNSVEFSLENGSFKDVKESMQLEAEACTEKHSENLQSQEIVSVEEYVQQQQEHEIKDVKELMQWETETSAEKCIKHLEAEESASTARPDQDLQEQSHKDVQPEPELHQKEYKVLQHEQELQEQSYNDAQPEEELQEQVYEDVQPDPELHVQQYNDADDESKDLRDTMENPLKSTLIARRVHSRTSSENLVSERSSPRKEKEWKRTLACKLYEERMQLKLCRDRAVLGCSDDMDMLWEAYEASGGSSTAAGDTKRRRNKVKGGAANTQEEDSVEEGEPEEEEEEDDDEGSARQLCCLQALKFSTRKMSFGGGKPSLAKISKVLKRMTALSRVGSRRNLQKG